MDKIILKRRNGKSNGINLIFFKMGSHTSQEPKLLTEITHQHSEKGIYITINHPLHELIPRLQRMKVDDTRFFFIDAITGKREETAAAYFLPSPRSLTELSIILTEKLRTKKYAYVIIDCASFFLSYNNFETVVRFLQHITNKLTYFKVAGFFFMHNEEKSRKLLSTISEFSDHVYEV